MVEWTNADPDACFHSPDILLRCRYFPDRKEKSLGRLSQKFIQLFLIGVSKNFTTYTIGHEPGGSSLISSMRPSFLPSLPPLALHRASVCLLQYEVISLSGAAEKLLGATPGPAGSISDKGMKTKVRRLYDIANVLTSLRLIDKVGFLPLPLPHE